MSLISDLEVQLRNAAAHKRERARRRGIGSLVTASVVAAVVATLLLVGGSEQRRSGDNDRGAAKEPQPEGALPVGTVIPKGEGTPPRDSKSTIVATGTAPVAGPWQLEVWRNHGGPSPPGEPRGRCLFIHLLDPPRGGPSGMSGFCGGLGFRKTPGFSRAQLNVQVLREQPGERLKRTRVEEMLVYGRVPERARRVMITAEGGVRIEVEPGEGPKSIAGDFFAIAVKPGLGHAKINWLDANGRPGSRGIAVRD